MGIALWLSNVQRKRSGREASGGDSRDGVPAAVQCIVCARVLLFTLAHPCGIAPGKPVATFQIESRQHSREACWPSSPALEGGLVESLFGRARELSTTLAWCVLLVWSAGVAVVLVVLLGVVVLVVVIMVDVCSITVWGSTPE